MGIKVDKPILVIGGGALATLWLLNALVDALSQSLSHWSLWILLGSVAGAGWWWNRPKLQHPLNLSTPVLSRDRVEAALSEISTVITQLESEAQDPQRPAVEVTPQVERIQSQITQIAQELDRDQVRIVVMGSKGAGKTKLVDLLQAQLQEQSPSLSPIQPGTTSLREAPSFDGSSTEGLMAEAWAIRQAIAADLVIFLITGDLMASELQVLQRLAPTKRLILACNKQDQQLPEERSLVMARVQQQVQALIPANDVVAIAAAPQAIKVRRHQSDGTVQEWLEAQTPNIAELSDRLSQILTQESQQLVWASSFQSALALQNQAKTALNDVRRIRALPIVERYQWISAGAAFANPVPTLDVLATAVINAQMVMDLGAVYRQRLSLAQAKKITQAIATLMLKMGLVEVATQAIAGLLKLGLVTYVAGGAFQGVSAAYLTRMVGLGLMEYFETLEPNLQMAEAGPLAIERVGEIVQTVFQKNSQTGFLKTFAQQALERLMPAAPSAAPPGAVAVATVPVPVSESISVPVPMQMPVQMPVPVTTAQVSPPALNLPLNLPGHLEGDRLEAEQRQAEQLAALELLTARAELPLRQLATPNPAVPPKLEHEVSG